MEENESDAKVRSRRRRSIRNLGGLPNTQAVDDCYGSTWLESDEPVKKRKKRRSSIFVGLPNLHSTPLREEAIGLLDNSLNNEYAGNSQILKDHEERTSKSNGFRFEEHDFLTDIEVAHAENYTYDNTNAKNVIPQATVTKEKCSTAYGLTKPSEHVENESTVEQVLYEQKSSSIQVESVPNDFNVNTVQEESEINEQNINVVNQQKSQSQVESISNEQKSNVVHEQKSHSAKVDLVSKDLKSNFVHEQKSHSAQVESVSNELKSNFVHEQKSHSAQVESISNEQKSNGEEYLHHYSSAHLMSSPHSESYHATGEAGSSGGSNITSPGSMAEASPCSMSPDYPISPSYISHFVDHGESFVESDSLQIQTAPVLSMSSTNKKSFNMISNVSLNSSDKENESLLNLNITPSSDVQVLNKSSPGFLSMCKNIAGKVVNFVKTSPSYLAGAMFDNSLSNKSSPVVLQENHGILNNGNSSISSQVEGMHISSTQQQEENRDGSYMWSKEDMRASVDKTLEEMEADIAAEEARTPKPPTPEPKTYSNLQKPIFNFDNENSSKKIGSASKAKSRTSSSSSSSSKKKKRDMTMFLQTFNAISDVYKNKPGSDSSEDAVFTDKTAVLPLRFSNSRKSHGSSVTDSSEDTVFTDQISFPPPRAPDRNRSKGSSVSDFDFLDQLMNADAKTNDNQVEMSSSQTSGQSIGDTSPNDTESTAVTQVDYSSDNAPVSQSETALTTPSSIVSTPAVDPASKPVQVMQENNELSKKQECEKVSVESKKDCPSDMTACSENELGISVPIPLQVADSLGLECRSDLSAYDMHRHLDPSSTHSAGCELDTGTDMNIGSEEQYSVDGVTQRLRKPSQTVESHISGIACKDDLRHLESSFTHPTICPQDSDGIVNTESVDGSLFNVDTANLQVDNVLKRKRKQVSTEVSNAKTAVTDVNKDETIKVLTEPKDHVTVGRKKVGANRVVGKRKSGQMKKKSEVVTQGVDMEQDDVDSCSVSKRKKKMVSPRAEEMGDSASLTNEKSSPIELTANIEDKISRLVLKKEGNKKTKESERKQRRKSGRLSKLVEIEKKEFIEGGLIEIGDNKNKDVDIPDSTVTESSSMGNIDLDIGQIVNPAIKLKTTVKKRPRGRRSSDFKDIPATVTSQSPEIAMDVSKITDEISQVNLCENIIETNTQSDLITVDNLDLPDVNDVQPKRRRRRSADAASLKIQLVCESENKACSPRTSSDPVTTLKGGRKRKLDTPPSEEELEKLYRNKNFVKPDERRPWQTIYESPANSEKLYSKNKLQRFIEFEKPTQAKINRRLKRAVKNGWDPRKMRKKELDDEIVHSKLDAMKEELDDSSDSLADSLKSIVETN